VLEVTYRVYYFKQNREKVFNLNDHDSLFFMQFHTLHVKQKEIFTIFKILNLNIHSFYIISSTKKHKYLLFFCWYLNKFDLMCIIYSHKYCSYHVLSLNLLKIRKTSVNSVWKVDTVPNFDQFVNKLCVIFL